MKSAIRNPLAPPEGSRRARSLALLLAAAGGLLNGLIGAGAGILFLYAAGLLGLTREDPRAKYAFSMACVLPVSLLSLALHPPVFSAADPEMLRGMILPAILGGGAGAILRDRVRAVWLNRAFAILTVLSGLFMILG